MKRSVFFLILALGFGPGLQGQTLVTYPATMESTAPAYVNAEVVAVNRSHDTVTFRTASGQTLLTADGDILSGLGGLRAGDKVILAYRAEFGANGLERRIVTGIRPASPGSGTPSRTASARVVTPAAEVVVTSRPVRTVSTYGTGSLALSAAPAASGVVAWPSGAERNFDATLLTMTDETAAIDRAWFEYRDACPGREDSTDTTRREWFGILDGSEPRPTDDTCSRKYDRAAVLALSLRDRLDAARNAAREFGVPPGQIRESLQRYNLDY